MASFEPLNEGETFPATCMVVSAGIGMVDTVERLKSELKVSSFVHVVTTPTAERWIVEGDLSEEIADLTGRKVTSVARTPWDPKDSTMYNRCVVAPVTLNTLSKWTTGQADNLAVSMLCEATWTTGVDVTAHLTLNGAYADHPIVEPAIETLRKAQVEIVPLEPGPVMKRIINGYPLHQLPDNLKPRL